MQPYNLMRKEIIIIIILYLYEMPFRLWLFWKAFSDSQKTSMACWKGPVTQEALRQVLICILGPLFLLWHHSIGKRQLVYQVKEQLPAVPPPNLEHKIQNKLLQITQWIVPFCETGKPLSFNAINDKRLSVFFFTGSIT